MIRRGSRINTDRFPKRALKAQTFSGVQGLAPPKNYLHFTPQSPLSIFYMKNVTDFRKTVETGVDPHLMICLFVFYVKAFAIL